MGSKEKFTKIIMALQNQWKYDCTASGKLEVLYAYVPKNIMKLFEAENGDCNIEALNNNFLIEVLLDELIDIVSKEGGEISAEEVDAMMRCVFVQITPKKLIEAFYDELTSYKNGNCEAMLKPEIEPLSSDGLGDLMNNISSWYNNVIMEGRGRFPIAELFGEINQDFIITKRKK